MTSSARSRCVNSLTLIPVSQAQARLEQTMQSKIRVYESRTANGPEADPDLPPELASALKLESGSQAPQVCCVYASR
jgi:hypothetical protein